MNVIVLVESGPELPLKTKTNKSFSIIVFFSVSRECYSNGTWSYLDAEKVYFEESVCYCEHCKVNKKGEDRGNSSKILAFRANIMGI